jgi:hypothetical protein
MNAPGVKITIGMTANLVITVEMVAYTVNKKENVIGVKKDISLMNPYQKLLYALCVVLTVDSVTAMIIVMNAIRAILKYLVNVASVHQAVTNVMN